MIAEGPPSRVLEQAIDGRIELLLPIFVLDELGRILTDKLGFDNDHVRNTRRLLERIAFSQPNRPNHVAAVTGDPSDDAILACAIDAGADILVTGDKKHLLPFGTHRGVRILTPQGLLADLRAND